MKLDVREGRLLVPGFRFGGVKAGIKASGAADLGLLVAERPAQAAAVFTRNRFAAAPVALGRERLRRGRLQALVVNSGNANACTGARGLADARATCAMVGRALGIDERLVVPGSTGLIGKRLPMDRLRAGVDAAIADASADGLWRFARAIMTTDAFPKVLSERVSLGGATITIAGVAKGAGMICPDMATLLVYLLTDAEVDARLLRRILPEVARASFNALTVDGDTSTNDSMFLVASGVTSTPRLTAGSAALARLGDALGSVATGLARQVAMDGEGATRMARIEVVGARSGREAERVARTVAGSPLVKTAIRGGDPNWGRIACAVGYSGVALDPELVTIRIGPVVVFRRGGGVETAREAARRHMVRPEVPIRIDLGRGQGSFAIFASDLSPAYVEFNSAYST